MENLVTRIESDFVQSRRDQNKSQKAALTAVKAQMQVIETSEERKSREPLTDEEVLTAVTKVNKSYTESLNAFKAAQEAEGANNDPLRQTNSRQTNSRQTNIETILSEMRYLQPYLPSLMTETEIQAALDEIIVAQTTPVDSKAGGRIMGLFNKQYPKKADNKLVEQLLKQKIGQA